MDHGSLQECFSSVLAEAETEQTANAMAVAAAVYAGVGIADRFRAAMGMSVVAHVLGSPQGSAVAGRVVDCSTESVTLQDAAGRLLIVRLAAVAAARGLPSGHRSAEGPAQSRLGFASALREATGEPVTLAVAGESLTGVLRRVGADHIELALPDGTALIALAAVAWLGTAG